MAKFILVRDYGEFDKIREYIIKNPNYSYYIAPKLMHDYLSSLRYRCVVGVKMESIKVHVHNRIDLVTIPVYNRVFEADAFRIEAIKKYELCKLKHSIEDEEVIFGVKEDKDDFCRFDVEKI